MTTPETFTPAVERAAELLIHEAETTGLIREDVRNGLAAALTDPDDPDFLARTLFVLYHGLAMTPELALIHWNARADWARADWRTVADGFRTALLGADS